MAQMARELDRDIVRVDYKTKKSKKKKVNLHIRHKLRKLFQIFKIIHVPEQKNIIIGALNGPKLLKFHIKRH